MIEEGKLKCWVSNKINARSANMLYPPLHYLMHWLPFPPVQFLLLTQWPWLQKGMRTPLQQGTELKTRPAQKPGNSKWSNHSTRLCRKTNWFPDHGSHSNFVPPLLDNPVLVSELETSGFLVERGEYTCGGLVDNKLVAVFCTTTFTRHGGFQ